MRPLTSAGELRTVTNVKILIAPDKFKGTLTARQAAEAIARGWRRSRPSDSLELLPISDGGDGFGAVLGELLDAKTQRCKTVDAAHRPITATWWWQAKTKTAVIESANIIGLAMLPPGKFHPFQLDTFGLGAALRAARRKGARRIILGIGGSATNDGGFGLARALGWEFRDDRGKTINQWPRLHTLADIRRPKKTVPGEITVAVDVRNPLLGALGATRVYGPQKGVRAEDFRATELCLGRLAMIAKKQLGTDCARLPGAGAAGGLGFGLATFAGGKLEPGFELFAKQAGLARRLGRYDLVITGEGALDRSTSMGKGAGQIATLCRTHQIPVLGLAGVVKETTKLRKLFVETHALTELTSPELARRDAKRWLTRLAEKVAARTNPVTSANLVGKRRSRR